VRPGVRWFPTRYFFGTELFDQKLCALRIFAERKIFTVPQRTPSHAAETRSQITRATSKNERDIYSTRDREPRATAKHWRFNREFFARAHERRMSGIERCRTDARFKFAATPNNDSLVSEP